MADALVAAAVVRARIAGATAGDDALLQTLIEQCTEWLQGPEGTGRQLVPHAATTLVFDTAYGSTLDVPQGIALLSGAGLEVATTDQPDSGATGYVAVSSSLVTLRPPSGRRRPGWPATQIAVLGTSPAFRLAINGARVTGTFGFATSPLDIVEICTEAVIAAWQARGKPAATTLGADGRAAFPWSSYFSQGSGHMRTIGSYRGLPGIG